MPLSRKEEALGVILKSFLNLQCLRVLTNGENLLFVDGKGVTMVSSTDRGLRSQGPVFINRGHEGYSSQ